jgi:hypothetical protein
MDLISNLYDHQVGTEKEPEIPHLVDKILSSLDYSELLQNISLDAQDIVVEMMDQSSESNILREKQDFVSANSNNTESWSMGSLTSGNCPGIDELLSILFNLGRQQTTMTRLDASQQLKAFSIGDLLSDEYWVFSKQCIDLVLGDPDIRVATVGLQLFARGFYIAPQYLIPDLYVLLVKNLDSKVSIEKFSIGCSEIEIQLKWKQFRLMQQCMTYLPSIWSRFTDPQMVDIMRSTIGLLKDNNRKCITPLHWISVIDPSAEWFKAWMISHWGRSYWINTMGTDDILPELCVHFLTITKSYISFSCDEILMEEVEMVNPTTIHPADMEYVYLLHVTTMISRLLMYNLGRRCFPVDLDVSSTQLIDQFTPDLFLTRIFTMMFSRKKLYNDDGSNINLMYYRMSNYCQLIIKDILSTGESGHDLVFRRELLDILIKPVQLTLEKKIAAADESLVAASKTLSIFASSYAGRRFLLENQSSLRDITSVIIEFSKDVIKFPSNTISSFLFLLQQFLQTYDGFEYLKKYEIHMLLLTLLLSHPEDAFSRTLTDCIICLAFTPRGLELLCKTAHIDKCVGFMFYQIRLDEQKFSQSQYQFEVLLSQIATSKEGMVALMKSGFIKYTILGLLNNLENIDICSPYYEARKNPQLQKSISILMKLFTTFVGMSSGLEFEMKSNVFVEKTSLTGIISNLILISDPNEFIFYEESRYVGLILLKHFTHTLDSIIFLEQKFGLVQRLVDHLQHSFLNIVGSGHDFVIDEYSVLLNHVLLHCVTVGGPNERRLPSFQFPKFIPSDYSSLVFKGHGIPNGVYIEKSNDVPIYDFNVKIQNASTLDQLKELYLSISEISSISRHDMKYFIDQFVTITIPKVHRRPNAAQELSEFDQIGMKTAIRYASRIIHIERQELFMDTLGKALLQFMTVNSEFYGFDWFVATLVITFEGDQQVMELLDHLQSVPHIDKLWTRCCPDSNAVYFIGHWVGKILEKECPKIHVAFQLAGCTPNQLVHKWIKQVFWNVLDFEMIQSYILITLLFGIDYEIYFCISLMRNSEDSILAASRENVLMEFMESPCKNGYELAYMSALEQKYRHQILDDL